MHGKEINNTLQSLIKVNNGNTYEIEITMNYEEKGQKEGEQQYYLNVRYKEQTINYLPKIKPLNSSELIKIRRAKHYLGGVPPTFNRSCTSHTNSFLGFLKPRTQLINENVSYGISLVSDKVCTKNSSIILDSLLTFWFTNIN